VYFVSFATFGCGVTFLEFSVAWVVKKCIQLKNDKNERKTECIGKERKKGAAVQRETNK
jgi:hypothetical protein